MYKLFKQIWIKDYFENQDRNSLYRDFFYGKATSWLKDLFILVLVIKW